MNGLLSIEKKINYIIYGLLYLQVANRESLKIYTYIKFILIPGTILDITCTKLSEVDEMEIISWLPIIFLASTSLSNQK